MKGHAGLTKFKDVNALAEGYINAEKMIGADKLVLPGKDAKPEDWDSVWNKLGRPEKVDGYQFPEVKDRPFTEADKGLQAVFAPIAHKLGLTQAQVTGLAEWQIALTTESIKLETEGAANAQAELRKEWGDQYDAKHDAAQRGLAAVLEASGQKIDSFKMMKLTDGTFAFDNPMLLRLFATFGESISEGGFVGSSGGGAGSLGAFATPESAAAELDRLYAKDFKDPNHPYMNKRDPQHKAWSDRVMRLNSTAQGAKQG